MQSLIKKPEEVKLPPIEPPKPLNLFESKISLIRESIQTAKQTIKSPKNSRLIPVEVSQDHSELLKLREEQERERDRIL